MIDSHHSYYEEHDLNILELADLPQGWQATRKDAFSSWIRVLEKSRRIGQKTPTNLPTFLEVQAIYGIPINDLQQNED